MEHVDQRWHLIPEGSYPPLLWEHKADMYTTKQNEIVFEFNNIVVEIRTFNLLRDINLN